MGCFLQGKNLNCCSLQVVIESVQDVFFLSTHFLFYFQFKKFSWVCSFFMQRWTLATFWGKRVLLFCVGATEASQLWAIMSYEPWAMKRPLHPPRRKLQVSLGLVGKSRTVTHRGFCTTASKLASHVTTALTMSKIHIIVCNEILF